MSLQNENVRFVQRRNVRFHGWPSSLFLRRRSAGKIGLTDNSRQGKSRNCHRSGTTDQNFSA